jgi:hypothetical protein
MLGQRGDWRGLYDKDVEAHTGVTQDRIVKDLH